MTISPSPAPSKIAQYAKFIVAAVGVAASTATALGLSQAWVPILLSVATALGVGVVPNAPKPPAPSLPPVPSNVTPVPAQPAPARMSPPPPIVDTGEIHDT